MKKTLVALATLAVAGGAFAQSPNARAIDASGVTIFGVADAAVVVRSADNAGSLTSLQGEGRNESTRLGFRGMEDMGGGWAAGFWLEAAYNQDTGTGSTSTNNNSAVGQNISGSSPTGTSNNTSLAMLGSSAGGTQGLTFNRAATVSLINKGIGEIRVGRDYVPSFWNMTQFDPFGTVGAAAATNIYFGTLGSRVAVAPPGNPSPQVRSSNSIGWLSNDMGGFRAQVMLGLSEALSGCADLGRRGSGLDNNLCIGANGDGKLLGGRLQYISGPLHLAAGYTKTSYANDATRAYNDIGAGATAATNSVAGYSGDYTVTNLAASYTIGATKLAYVVGLQTYGEQTTPFSSSSAAALTNTGQTLTAGAAGTAAGAARISKWEVATNMLGVTHTMGPWTLKGSYMTGKKTGGQTSIINATATSTKAYYDVADALPKPNWVWVLCMTSASAPLCMPPTPT